MAKVVLSPIMSQVSGPVGNEVFVRTAGKTYLRARPKRKVPFSSLQLFVQSRYSVCVDFWWLLPQYLRDAWNTAAVPAHLSGWNNCLAENLPHARIDNLHIIAPAHPDYPPILTFTAVDFWLPGNVTLKITTDYPHDAHRLNIFYTDEWLSYLTNWGSISVGDAKAGANLGIFPIGTPVFFYVHIGPAVGEWSSNGMAAFAVLS